MTRTNTGEHETREQVERVADVAGVLYGCEARQEDVESHGGQNSLVLINGVSLSVKGVGP